MSINGSSGSCHPRRDAELIPICNRLLTDLHVIRKMKWVILWDDFIYVLNEDDISDLQCAYVIRRMGILDHISLNIRFVTYFFKFSTFCNQLHSNGAPG